MYVPALQDVQEEAPEADHVFRAHVAQPIDPADDHVPALHAAHAPTTVAPLDADHVPALQLVHAPEVAADHVPALQTLQAEDPATDHVPALQATHALATVAPVDVDHVPALHAMHVAAPTVDDHVPALQVIQLPP